MICPSCGHDNFDGVDECAECLTSMAHEDLPSEQALDRIGRALMDVRVSHLGPAKPITITEDAALQAQGLQSRHEAEGRLQKADRFIQTCEARAG